MSAMISDYYLVKKVLEKESFDLKSRLMVFQKE